MIALSILPSAKQTGLAMARSASFASDPEYARHVDEVVRQIGQKMTEAGALVAPADLRSWMAQVRSSAVDEIKRLHDPATRHAAGEA